MHARSKSDFLDLDTSPSVLDLCIDPLEGAGGSARATFRVKALSVFDVDLASSVDALARDRREAPIGHALQRKA